MLLTALVLCCTWQEPMPAEGDGRMWREVDLPGFPEGDAFVLGRLSNAELLRTRRGESVLTAILLRAGIDGRTRRSCLLELARLRGVPAASLLLEGLVRIERTGEDREDALDEVARLLLELPPEQLAPRRDALVALARDGGRSAPARRAGWAAACLAGVAPGVLWELAGEAPGGRAELLSAVALIPAPAVRAGLHGLVVPRLAAGVDPDLRRAAIGASAHLAGHEAEVFAILAACVARGDERDAAIAALLRMPPAAWPADGVPALAGDLADLATAAPPAERGTPGFKRVLQLGEELATRLPPERARALRATLGELGARVVTLRAVPHLLLFDKPHLVVRAGESLELTFENPGVMPHNLVVAAPGSLELVGAAADLLIGAPAAADGTRFVPATERVLFATPLVMPGAAVTLSFAAPQEPGSYPYLCSVPGHWVRMNGVLHVVEDVGAHLAAHPELAPAPVSAQRSFVRRWILEDLTADLPRLDVGRSPARGAQLFGAFCAQCHRVGPSGAEVGPDLSEAAGRMGAQEMLQQVLEPDRRIEEPYRVWAIDLDDGTTVFGRVVERGRETIRVVENPVAASAPVELRREWIATMEPSPVSTMPARLLDTLTREEILDLLAFVRAPVDG